MRRLWIAVLLAACSREPTVTNTITPADAAPAPTLTDTMEFRGVTTSGSPVPASAVAPGNEAIVVTERGFEVRPLLPRAHVAFRIENRTPSAHHVALRSRAGSREITIPASGRSVLQLVLQDAEYELVCLTPGHAERAHFRTYDAGKPITR